MFKLKKKIIVSGAHKLILDYESPCQNIHGHNWIIYVYCKSEKLDNNGMIIDFSKVKKIVNGFLDHQNLNDSLNFNPTAENIAKFLCEQIPFCYKIKIIETPGSEVCFVKDK